MLPKREPMVSTGRFRAMAARVRETRATMGAGRREPTTAALRTRGLSSAGRIGERAAHSLGHSHSPKMQTVPNAKAAGLKVSRWRKSTCS